MCNTTCQSLRTKGNANAKEEEEEEGGIEFIGEKSKNRAKERHRFECSLVISFIGKLWLNSDEGWRGITIDFCIAQKSHRKFPIYWKYSRIHFFSLLPECPFAFSTHQFYGMLPRRLTINKSGQKRREYRNWRMKFNIVLVSYLICLVSKEKIAAKGREPSSNFNSIILFANQSKKRKKMNACVFWTAPVKIYLPINIVRSSCTCKLSK